MQQRTAALRQLHTRLFVLLVFALLLLGSACRDGIPSADDPVAQGGDPVALAEAGDQAERLWAAVEFSITARALYATLGRSGASEFEGVFEIGVGNVEAIQHDALSVILESFGEQQQAVLASLSGREQRADAQLGVSTEQLGEAIDHIAGSVERIMTRGRADRVHPLYVDRLDRNLIALSGVAEPGSGVLSSAIAALNGHLDQLELALIQSCVVLQCRAYGVSAPLTVAARTALLVATARAMSVTPAVMSWLTSYDLSEADRNFLLSAMQVSFVAASHQIAHNVALIHGANEEERRTYLAAHRSEWPFNAIALTRTLLTRYESTAAPAD